MGQKSQEFSSLLFTATSANGFYPPTRAKCGLKLAWNVNNVYGDLNSENSQDYVQKPKRNCTFMNSVSALFYRQQSTISALSLYKSCINTPGYPLTALLLNSVNFILVGQFLYCGMTTSPFLHYKKMYVSLWFCHT